MYVTLCNFKGLISVLKFAYACHLKVVTRIAGGQATCYGNKITILIWPFCFNKGLSILQV